MGRRMASRRASLEELPVESSRRRFLKESPLLMAGARAALAVPFAWTAARSAPSAPVAETTFGKLRGRTDEGIHVFRGVPYGANTSGKNRFMPPRKPAAWKDVDRKSTRLNSSH